MSTNYYWIAREGGVDEDDIRVHIGKTAGAGDACNECGVAKQAHSDSMHYGDRAPYPHLHGDACPMCDEPWSGRAMSFIWTAFKHRWRLEALAATPATEGVACVVDEYGQTLTAQQLLDRMPPSRSTDSQALNSAKALDHLALVK